MKKSILIICAGLTFLGCKAQSISTKSMGNRIVYSISRYEEKAIIKNEKNRFFNANNNYPSSALVNGIPDITSIRVDQKQLATICAQVLTLERLKILQRENNMGIDIYLNDKGEVLEVAYYLDADTKLSARELEEIELELKTKIKGKVLNDDLKGVTYINQTFFINFSELLQIKQAK